MTPYSIVLTENKADLAQDCRLARAVGGMAFRCMVLLTGLLLMVAAPSKAAVVVDGSTKYQTMRGFGAASAWNSGVLNSIAAALFADDSAAPVASTASHINGHIGLSMLRTRIDPTGSFANEAGAMTLAKGQNPNMIIWSTEWSPPAAYKNNNNVNGPGANNTFNSTAANSTAYANYLVNYIKTIQSTYGVTLYAVSPQNEPDWNTSYESCLWTGAQFQDFVKTYLAPAIAAAGLSTKIMITESFADNLSLAAPAMNDPVAAPLVSIIGGHLYGGGPFALSSGGFSHLTNQENWQTEISDVSATPNDTSMVSGLQEATWIHNCVVNASMNAFHHWWIVTESTTGGVADNSGLCDNKSNPTKKFYVLGNFSKFIRPGFQRIAIPAAPAANITCSAYASASRLVIVAINKGTSSSSQTFTLGGGLNAASVVPWVTDPSNNLVQQAAVAVSGGSFTFNLPAQGVVTFVCDLAAGGTPTFTATLTGSSTATRTAVPPTPSYTVTRSASPSATLTPSPTATRTATTTLTSTPSVTRTATLATTPTFTHTSTASPSATPPDTASATPTRSPTPSATLSPSRTPSPSATLSDTALATLTRSPTRSTTPPDTASSTPSLSPTLTMTLTATALASTATSTATRTATALASATASPTPVPSATRTSLPTALPSRTASPVPSSTETRTPLATAMPTPAATTTSTVAPGSPTATATAIPTTVPTSVPTASATPLLTALSTMSPTAVSTAIPTTVPTSVPTASATPLLTALPTMSPTAVSTAIPTTVPTMVSTAVPTAIPTAVPTAVPTSLPTVISTASATASATAPATASATVSATVSVTVSATSPPTALPTATATPTWSPAATATRTSTSVPPSMTATPSASPTLSCTPSPLATATPTGITVPPTATATFQGTAVPTQALTPPDGPLKVERLVAVPNPDPTAVMLLLDGHADGVTLRIWSLNFRLLAERQVGPLPGGWSRVMLPEAAWLPNGTYYLNVSARRGGAQVHSWPIRFVILR